MKLRAGLVAAAVGLAGLAPARVGALEPRFDHRDQHGILLESRLAFDSVAVAGRATASTWRPTLRAAWSIDLVGEGNELVLGAQSALRGWSDPARERALLAVDARYRAYFGTEELKTFFDAGLWSTLRSRWTAGPLVGIGACWDFSRAVGVHLGGEFATGLGEARIASFALASGVQVRFD